MAKLDRTPDGKFMDPYAAIHYWLIPMLHNSEKALCEMVEIGAKFCVLQAATCYQRQAGDLTREEDFSSDWQIRQATKWKLRYEVLIEAAHKLRGI